MAGTINYLYDPNQQVWVINSNPCNSTNTKTVKVGAVQEGTVIQLTAIVLATGTTLSYNVRLADNAGVFPFPETDIFPTLNAAITEYELRLT